MEARVGLLVTVPLGFDSPNLADNPLLPGLTERFLGTTTESGNDGIPRNSGDSIISRPIPSGSEVDDG